MLDVLFGSRLRAKTLGWLMTHPDERYYVRQLAGLIQEDNTNLSRELGMLAGLGLLTTRTEGRQKYYQANSQSPVFAELRSLIVKTSGVADVIRAALSPLSASVRIAFIYGSVARGEETAESDVDVLVVGAASFSDVAAALADAQKQLGREVNASVYPPAEVEAKLRAGHHFLKSVWQGQKIFVIGGERELERLGEERVAAAAPDQPRRDRRPVRRGRARPR